MKIIKGTFIILVFLAVGNLCSWAIGNFLPGSVIGMVLLFLALMCRIVKAETVRPVADFLTQNMTLFFLPASIGIMEQWGLIKLNLVAWLVLLVVPTLCVLVSVCLTQDGMMALTRRLKKGRAENE